ncbi:DUF4007 family protein [Rugamonas sp.]|uniref:DUF4007 family protein n=1 Tax=Rugamonas sp. TaxID=1926287 RepID=UPI0025D5A15F|nr:DUF4007 family protein [Rugamonas sp.]
MITANERFSGHESFICRYGWLPKIFHAISQDPLLLKQEEQAMHTLGIGRNMVKSLQFWAEATGVITSAGPKGHIPGPIGICVFGKDGWDPYLETLETLWLMHWQLSTNAGLAAWAEVFGEGKQVRFDRPRLVAALAQRGEKSSRPLAASTLEQHASIFIQTYFQAERGTDDTSWCPLQDLGLITAAKSEDNRILYSTEGNAPVGLSLRVFGMALVDFILRQSNGTFSVDFGSVLKGANSPGIVFRMDEHQLRHFIDAAIAGAFEGAMRFVDTADTQSVILLPKKLNSQYRLRLQEEALEHA